MEDVIWGTTVVRVVNDDITALDVDAIVNAANSSLLGGGGVDGAIHRAAGPALLEACRAVVARQGGCEPGDAVSTAGGRLRASHVVHTVGPIWTGHEPVEHDRLLASCYATSIDLAEQLEARSVAFPNISTGVYRFPRERAATVALNAVRNRLEAGSTLEVLVFCCFDQANCDLYVERVG